MKAMKAMKATKAKKAKKNRTPMKALRPLVSENPNVAMESYMRMLIANVERITETTSAVHQLMLRFLLSAAASEPPEASF